MTKEAVLPLSLMFILGICDTSFGKRVKEVHKSWSIMFLKIVERSEKVQLRATIMFQVLEKLLVSGFRDLNLFIT